MAYRVDLASSAAKAIQKLPTVVAERVTAKIATLAGDPRVPGVQKLQGAEDLYRLRVGNYRVIFTIQEETATVLVVKVADRKDAYR
jgi:mRNA interferase RelE/StbE